MANIIVIGGSAAGMSFSAKYKRNNPDDTVIVFESHDYISFGACGLPYYLQDQFDDKSKLFARTPNQMIDNEIDVRINATVSEVNPDQKYVVVDEVKYFYDKLIVATGAKPVSLPHAVVDHHQIFTLTTMEDGDSLKEKLHSGIKHITIIGGGFIGLEILDAAAHLNLDVTLVEQGESILSQSVDPDISEQLVSELNTYDNLEVLLNTQCIALTQGERVKLTLSTKKLTTDAVIYALGFKPNTKLIDCDKLENGAIIVDKHGRTSLSDVYAVGDCATTMNLITAKPMYLPLATNANKFARSLADNLSNLDTAFTGMVGTSCIKILDYDLAATGLTSQQLETAGIEYKTKTIVDKTHTHYYHGAEDIKIKLLYCPNTLRIYGGQIIGHKDVVGRINPLAMAVTVGLTTTQLGAIDFAYAPPFARTWEALNVAGNVSK